MNDSTNTLKGTAARREPGMLRQLIGQARYRADSARGLLAKTSMKVFENSKSDVLSATAKIKCGFCAPPRHDSVNALHRSRSCRTGDEGRGLADRQDGGGDACDGSVF